MQDQIIELLASGLERQAVLDTVGCSPEQFNEILKDEGFTLKLKVRAQELAKDRIALKYVQLEEKVLKHVSNNLDEYDAHGLCKILDSVSRQKLLLAQQNGANHFQNPTAGQNQVILILPASMTTQRVIKNDRNEVVAINDRNMGSLPIDGVRELFSKFTVQPTTQAKNEVQDVQITSERPGNYENQDASLA